MACAGCAASLVTCSDGAGGVTGGAVTGGGVSLGGSDAGAGTAGAGVGETDASGGVLFVV